MGKTKRRDRTKARADPAAKPIKPPSDPELAAIREKKILPIIAGLTSTEPKRRTEAATAIANLIEDSRCRKLLLREQLVRILLEQTITDQDLESKCAGWGMLRNLALEEEADFCVHLYRQDILTAINSVLKNVTASNLEPVAKLPRARQQLAWTLLSSVAGLLGSLVEAQDEVITSVLQLPDMIECLFIIIRADAATTQTHEDALTALLALSEDNKPLAQRVTANSDFIKLLDAVTLNGKMEGVLACGILHNIYSAMGWFDHNTPMAGASDAKLVPALVECMRQSQAEAEGQKSVANGDNGSSPERVLQVALEITASIATCLQEALEHGTKHEKEFEGFDADDDEKMADDGSDIDIGEDEDADEHEDEIKGDAMDADMDMVTGPDRPSEEPEEVSQTLSLLVNEAGPCVLQLVHSNPQSTDLQIHAISVLNNISWTISSIDFSADEDSQIKKTWITFADKTWTEIVVAVLAANTADINLASSVTSLAWAIAKSLQGRLTLQGSEHQKFMALYQASKNIPESKNPEDAFQSLGVMCIGVLGRLALDPAPVALNREIGVFLLTVLGALPETPAADVVEALNEIFDIYADNSYACDKVFWDDNFYSHLEEIAPKVKTMAKAIDKRKFPELRLRADEVHLNLGRFLKYKKGERGSHQ